MAYTPIDWTLTILGNKTNWIPKKQVKTGTCIESSVTNLSPGSAAFQLILSSGRSCRPSKGSPRPHANFFHYITLNAYICWRWAVLPFADQTFRFRLGFSTLICHLSGQGAFFVGSWTRDPFFIWNTGLHFSLTTLYGL